ncbi:MAG: polysaccharide biosynthesis/export family protein [Alphaproteobacteria bacterium]
MKIGRLGMWAPLAMVLVLVGMMGSRAAWAQDDIIAALEMSSLAEYELGPNDRVRVTVFGEDDLSGEYQVDSTGFVALPLIGEVLAGNLSLREFESAVEARYADGYLINPKVSIEVTNYRPFFINGEVNEAGQYPFEPNMTILKAVSTAGGYTYRANRRKVFVLRPEVHAEEIEVPANSDLKVMPGDVLRIPERLF